MNQIWFVTTEAHSPEGYYVGAATDGKAKAFGANEFGCDFTAVKVECITGQQTAQEGIIPVWQMNCFLCGADFSTTHDPMEVPPACDSCRAERGEEAKLDGNNL